MVINRILEIQVRTAKFLSWTSKIPAAPGFQVVECWLLEADLFLCMFACVCLCITKKKGWKKDSSVLPFVLALRANSLPCSVVGACTSVHQHASKHWILPDSGLPPSVPIS